MMPFILYRKSTAINEKGFVLFELLIAMTLLAGSITVLHTIYANLIAKQTQIQKAHDEIIERSNQYEIAMARESTLRHTQTEKRPDLHSLSRGQTK